MGACGKHLCFSTSVIFVRCNVNNILITMMFHAFVKVIEIIQHNLYIGIIFAQSELTKIIELRNAKVYTSFKKNCYNVYRIQKSSS